jgi:hypothetical protein
MNSVFHVVLVEDSWSDVLFEVFVSRPMTIVISDEVVRTFEWISLATKQLNQGAL